MAEPALNSPANLSLVQVSGEFAQWFEQVISQSNSADTPLEYLINAWFSPQTTTYIREVLLKSEDLPADEKLLIRNTLQSYIGAIKNATPSGQLRQKISFILNFPLSGSGEALFNTIQEKLLDALNELNTQPDSSESKRRRTLKDKEGSPETVPATTLGDEPSPSPETEVTYAPQSSQTATVPTNIPGLPANFSELSTAEQTKISSQVIAMQAGFAQNQAAIALWQMAGQPVPENPFAALPPDVQAALRSNSLKMVMSAAAAGQKWGTFEVTQSTLLAMLAENPTIAVQINDTTNSNNLPTFTSEQPAEDLTTQLQKLEPETFAESPAETQFNELATQQAVTTSYDTASTNLKEQLSAAGLPPADVANIDITLQSLVATHADLDVALAAAAADPNQKLFPWLANHPQRKELYNALRYHGENLKIAAAQATGSSGPLVSFVPTPTSDAVLQAIAQAPAGQVADLSSDPSLQENVASINQEVKAVADEVGQARESLRDQVDLEANSLISTAVMHTPRGTMQPALRKAVSDAGISPGKAENVIRLFQDNIDLPEAQDPTIQRMAKWYRDQDQRNLVLQNWLRQQQGENNYASSPYEADTPGLTLISSQQVIDLDTALTTGTYDYQGDSPRRSSKGGLREWWKSIFKRKTTKPATKTIETAKGIKRFSQFILQTTQKAKKAIDGSKIFTLLKSALPAVSLVAKPILAVLGAGLGVYALGKLLSGLGSLASNLLGLATGGSKASLAGLTKASTGFQTTSSSSSAQFGGATNISTNLSNPTQLAGIKSTIGNTLSNPVIQIGGLGGGISVFLISAATLQNIFLNPLPIGDALESPYVNIEKVAIRGGNTVTELQNTDVPSDITYRITISPKEDYTLSINGYFDSMGVRFNQEAYQGRGATPPTVNSITRNSSNPNDFRVVTPETATQLEPGKELVLEYTQNLSSDWQDAAVQNDFTLQFDYSSDAESGTGEIADARATLCIGECPVAQAGLWPSCGRISQMPFNEPRYDGVSLSSHSACGSKPCVSPKGIDAFDVASGGPVPVHASFNGRLCAKPFMNQGYGTYLILDQIPGADFKVVFAHMSATIFGSSSSACQDVSAGDYIGLTGNTGNSSGIHLHYELNPPVGLQSRIVDYVPDQNVTPGFVVTQCYAASR